LEGSVKLSQAAMISERIQDFARGLEPEPRRLLEVLSVAQEDLPLEVALKAAGQPSDSMSPFLLIREGMVRERRDPGGEWLGLTRTITATSVLAELETEAIRELHAGLVDALSELEESPWREYRISLHRAFAASAQDAPRALVSLGEWMARKHYYSRALEMLDHATTDVQMDPLTAIHCALARGSALQGLSRTLEAGEALVAARRLAEEQGRGDLRSRALLQLAEARRVYGSSTRSAAAAKEALQGLSGPFLDRFRGPVNVLLGCAACRQGKLAKGENLLRKSLLDGDAEQNMRARTALADCLQLSGRVEEAETELSAVLADLGADDSPVLQVEALYLMSRIHLCLGRANLANQSLDQIDALTRRRGLSRLGVAVSTGRAAVHFACGDLEGCGRFLRLGQGMDRAPTRVRLDWWELRARHRLALGDRPAAMAAHHRGKEEAEMVGWLSRRAYHVGMEAVLTGRGEALSKALQTLTEAGVEGYRARVLLLGVAVGGDDEVFSVALEASRQSGDLFLLLNALERACTPEALVEARELVRSCARQMHGELLSGFRSTTVARWVDGQA
jgi:tetratricopeptide (TPR) repeat protein